MKLVIRLTKKQEIEALPILLRHSPGMVLPNQTYVINADAAKALREAGINYSELGSDTVGDCG